MKAAIAIASKGSIHHQAVKWMIVAPTSTATQPSTSSNKCHETTLSFIVVPLLVRKAAQPLTMTPSIARAIIPEALPGLGESNLGIAWTRMSVEPAVRTTALIREARRESRLYP